MDFGLMFDSTSDGFGCLTPHGVSGLELSIRQGRLIDEALRIEQEEAWDGVPDAYMPRTLVQATLPHKDPRLPPGTLYSRTTGRTTLTIAPTSPRHGIPYGSIPRLILAWICTEVVQDRNRVLSLGRSQANLLRVLHMHNNGHDIQRVRDQSSRLFAAAISIEDRDGSGLERARRMLISDRSTMLWLPSESRHDNKWESTLELSEPFFREIIETKVPLRLHVLHALAKSPMSMDIYTWLVYRMFCLRVSGKRIAHVPWAGLQAQFGAGYPESSQGRYDFKANFRKRLREVLVHYPEAYGHVDPDLKSWCLTLTPCPLHIPRRRQK
jgi:hypothetical protein